MATTPNRHVAAAADAERGNNAAIAPLLWLLLGLGILALGTGARTAWGQDTPSVPADPAPPGSSQAVPEQVEPAPPGGSTGSSGSLSEQLQQGGSVIKPPAQVDPGIVEQAPPAENFPTPVIPPGAAPDQQPPQQQQEGGGQTQQH